MNALKLLLLLSSVLSSALLSLDAQAAITFEVTPIYDPGVFGPAGGGYTWADLKLPTGTQIGTDPLYLDLRLTAPITLNDAGAGYNYGFGMSGFNAPIPQNGEAFTFYIQLLNNGSPITPDFATLAANPYTFGFTQLNPFANAVGNLYVTTSTGALDPSLTFNEVMIEVFNNISRPGTQVGSFGVSLGVNNLVPVPEPSTYIAGGLLLLPFGASTLRILRKRQVP
jgi:hypothetical protein